MVKFKVGGNCSNCRRSNRLLKNLQQLCEPNPGENLSPALVEKTLWFQTLRELSVSRLEEFASMPVSGFFIRFRIGAPTSGKFFELDARERGSFQHDVSQKNFTNKSIGEGKTLARSDAGGSARKEFTQSPTDSRKNLPRRTAARHGGIAFLPRGHWRKSLQDFVAVHRGVACADKMNLDPVAAELDFGTKEIAAKPPGKLIWPAEKNWR